MVQCVCMKKRIKNTITGIRLSSANNVSSLGQLAASSLLLIAFLISSCENDEKDIVNWTKKEVMKEEATHMISYLSQDDTGGR